MLFSAATKSSASCFSRASFLNTVSEGRKEGREVKKEGKKKGGRQDQGWKEGSKG
jgi:hypothetical protein